MPRRSKAEIAAAEEEARLNARLAAIMEPVYGANERGDPERDQIADGIADSESESAPGSNGHFAHEYGQRDGATARIYAANERRDEATGEPSAIAGDIAPELAGGIGLAPAPVPEASADVSNQNRLNGIYAIPSSLEAAERPQPTDPGTPPFSGSSRSPGRRGRKPRIVETAASGAQAVAEGIKSVLPTPVKEPAAKMSAREAEAMRPQLLQAAKDYFEYADGLIAATTGGGRKEIVIWSNMSERELGLLVDNWLRRAQTSVKAAKRVRRAVSVQNDVIGPMIILMPRFVKTIQAYREFGVDLTGGL